MPTTADLAVKSLGPCRIDSPLKPLLASRRTTAHYVAEDDRVFFHDTARLAARSRRQSLRSEPAARSPFY